MYQMPKLNYSFSALEPHIDERTVEIHYTKHMQGYLDRLNTALNGLGYHGEEPLEELVKTIDQFPILERGTILYNAGGVLNHQLYFDNMSPNHNTIPTGKIKEAIDRQYGSFDQFKEEFIKMTSYLVGSGYTFLVLNKQKQLEIVNLSNQETPYSYGLIPIMTIDLWEHAYYLKYQNRRSEYINQFFELVDFKIIDENYQKALQKPLS